MARSDPTRSVRAVAFSVFEVTTAVLYGVYEHTLASIVPYLVPEHTREAAFQLFCDLRSNTPKDRRFVKRHMAALLPETITGWIAMMSTALYAGGALAATLCVLLGVASAALFSCVGLVLVTGGFLGTAFAVFALGLLATSCIAGVLGSATALGYVSVVTTSSAWRYLFGVLFRGAPVIPDSIRELPVSKSAGQVFGLSPAGPVRGSAAAVQPGISFAAVADAAQETHIAEAAANGISEDGSSKLGADAPSRSASDASETSQPGKPSRKSSKARRKAQAAARAQQ
ncbi:hypothetical protein WJX72_006386 [[Myrmecia] bisecta]|uniref:Transmembrane protein n=1 Tax=[Myrmecia] bisecta TaxID=41462 RepID=A0AAW1QAV6_9CHLO